MTPFSIESASFLISYCFFHVLCLEMEIYSYAVVPCFLVFQKTRFKGKLLSHVKSGNRFKRFLEDFCLVNYYI